jgi:hypothetical protein
VYPLRFFLFYFYFWFHFYFSLTWESNSFQLLLDHGWLWPGMFFLPLFSFSCLFFFYIFFILNQSDLPNPESAWNFIIRLLSVSHFYLVSFPMLTSLSKFLFLFCFWKSFNEARFDDFHIKFLESNWAFNDIA